MSTRTRAKIEKLFRVKDAQGNNTTLSVTGTGIKVIAGAAFLPAEVRNFLTAERTLGELQVAELRPEETTLVLFYYGSDEEGDTVEEFNVGEIAEELYHAEGRFYNRADYSVKYGLPIW